jgi:hypothetical protein
VIRAHQPGSEPIDIPESIPNPVVVPEPTPVPVPTDRGRKELVRLPDSRATAVIALSGCAQAKTRLQFLMDQFKGATSGVLTD